ncbi:MAG TPA: AAA family ATPase [Synergistaceae bacterium]|mgnify:CR=1 FL=1|nr:AAA family ATPase [Synergistaceae bacterium]
MLRRMHIRNMTVFSDADLIFSPALNVFAGENGTGKTHILKVAYALLAATAAEGRIPGATPSKTVLQPRIADKLVAVFRAETLGRLARRRQGRARCDVALSFDNERRNTAFSFATNSKSEVSVDQLPGEWGDVAPVYFPTRELLTIYPGFVPMYDAHYLEFEETWRDTCLLLGAPVRKGARERRVRELLEPLEDAMGGSMELDGNGRFYLRTPGGRMEMPLVAEGHRKLGMVARLIATGALLEKGYLFWDEPEANLNPRIVRQVARTILALCANGIQVFAATHSLFLLRELDILLGNGVRSRFFGLRRGDDGATVEQGDSVDDMGNITALDEELDQSDRYMEQADRA